MHNVSTRESGRTLQLLGIVALGLLLLPSAQAKADDGIYARFKLVEPADATYRIGLRGYIHKPNWYLPRTDFPAGDARLKSGQWSDWFDIKTWAGKDLHGRMKRSGGMAEFPNVALDLKFDGGAPPEHCRLMIELATDADPKAIVKRFDDQFKGTFTSFLVSPTLEADADELETFTQMTDRHLRWAREITGGKRVAPKDLIIQTSFYGPNIGDAEVLWMLGVNAVGHTTPEIREKFPELRSPGHSHSVRWAPWNTREDVEGLADTYRSAAQGVAPGVVFNFSDEICARPPIGVNAKGREHFRTWLAKQKIDPKSLGVDDLRDVVPIEHPDELKAAKAVNEAAANRVFYYTSRFRQHAMTERVRWHTEVMHEVAPEGVLTSSLVADHPYFGGTGLGMGVKTSNFTWGNYPLAADWFELAREKALDVVGIEDWMGLQYMYGPSSTWEGFQLMGFQASMIRSGGKGEVPIQSWITPSDERNLRLKSTSALAQGGKHFFYWTWGPTSLGTENYWSDLRTEYVGVATMARHMAASEHIIAPGKVRKTRVALLYSVSADIWQPFGYIHMLERRGTYFSLIHDQYLVDMITEEDIEAGRLNDYDVLYATDANITGEATKAITQWVRDGGHLYGSCAAGTRNEYDESVAGLAPVFGIKPEISTTEQEGRYWTRAALNGMDYLDTISLNKRGTVSGGADKLGVLGVKATITPSTGAVIGTFDDGKPAAVANTFGKGKAVYYAACPGLTYIKDAKYVFDDLAEKWPAPVRATINAQVRAARAPRLVELSHAVVEAGVYDSDKGTALVLANFTYEPISMLKVSLNVATKPSSVTSQELGGKKLKFTVRNVDPQAAPADKPFRVEFTTALKLSDIIVIE